MRDKSLVPVCYSTPMKLSQAGVAHEHVPTLKFGRARARTGGGVKTLFAGPAGYAAWRERANQHGVPFPLILATEHADKSA